MTPNNTNCCMCNKNIKESMVANGVNRDVIPTIYTNDTPKYYCIDCFADTILLVKAIHELIGESHDTGTD